MDSSISTDATCPVCVKNILGSEDGIGCDGACQRWFHRECIDMTKSEYQRLSANNKIKWFCSRVDCIPSSDQPHNLILKQLSILTATITNLTDKVDSLISLPAKVDSLVCGMEDLNRNISQLETRLSVNESKVLVLEEKLGSKTQQEVNTESIISEMSDRARRSKNVMLFNVPESQDKNVDSRIKHDNDLVSKLIAFFMPNNSLCSFKTARVGRKSPNKSRPLKAILNQESDVMNFLSRFSTESAAELDQRLSDVKASRDRTPREMELFKSLKAQLEERKSKGECDITIKYKNNVPSIVKNQKNS